MCAISNIAKFLHIKSIIVDQKILADSIHVMENIDNRHKSHLWFLAYWELRKNYLIYQWFIKMRKIPNEVFEFCHHFIDRFARLFDDYGIEPTLSKF